MTLARQPRNKNKSEAFTMPTVRKPKIIRSIKSMQTFCRQQVAKGKSIALVPTMGFLHKGHLSLIRKGLKKADIVITTIFVNPTQFAPNEDLSKYPRDEKGDIARIASAGGQIIFIPSADQIYPDSYQTFVSVERLTQLLEGACRPTHFRGVTTIVAKLFNITRPDFALFGMKDFQQAMVLNRMAQDLDYPIKMIISPTIREKDGLAMSSRNKYFNSEQRAEAICLYRALKEAKKLVARNVLSPAKVEKKMRSIILSICPSAKIEYISFNQLDTLEPVKKIGPGTVCSLAVKLHAVRLIDNLKLA